MYINIVIILPILFLMVVPALAGEPKFIISGKVENIIDAGTLLLDLPDHNMKMTLQLYGVEPPEARQPCGMKAFALQKRKLLGKNVTVEIYEKTPSNQMISIVRYNGRSINRDMIAEGWAWAVKTGLDAGIDAELAAAEGEARKAHRGVWRQQNPEPPWEFRKRLAQQGKTTPKGKREGL
jgi:micrococcal nuclease